MDINSVVSKLIVLILVCCQSYLIVALEEITESFDRFKIEGVVERPYSSRVSEQDWFSNIHVYTNTGFKAFLKEDGSFVLNNLPWGAHFIYVFSPDIAYAPVRVDLNTKGKSRVRKLNHLQPSKVELISGPLRLTPLGPMRYFHVREQWRITDLLFNPMVLMTVLPLLLLLLIPKMGDAESRREIEAQFQMPKSGAPDLSEIMTNLFKGGSEPEPRKIVARQSGSTCAGQRSSRRKEK